MSSHEERISSAGRPLGPGAVAVMLMLCLSWGFNQIAVKLALPDMPAMMQATFRSVGALPAMMAELMAPIEMPATQSGWRSASASAS